MPKGKKMISREDIRRRSLFINSVKPAQPLLFLLEVDSLIYIKTLERVIDLRRQEAKPFPSHFTSEPSNSIVQKRLRRGDPSGQNNGGHRSALKLAKLTTLPSRTAPQVPHTRFGFAVKELNASFR